MRAGAVAAFGMKSRREGDVSVQAYRRGQHALRKGGNDVSVEERLAIIESALDALFFGLVQTRAQIGSGVAVDVAGHTLTAKTRGRR